MKLSKVRSNFKVEYTDELGNIWYVTYKIVVEIGRYRDSTPTFVFTKSDGGKTKFVSLGTGKYHINTAIGGVWYDEEDKCVIVAGAYGELAGWSKISLDDLFLVPDGDIIKDQLINRFGARLAGRPRPTVLSVYKGENGYVFLYVVRHSSCNYNKSRSIFNPPTVNFHFIHCTNYGGSIAVPVGIVPYLDSYKYRSKRHHVEANESHFYIRHKNNPKSGWCYAFKNYTWYKLGII